MPRLSIAFVLVLATSSCSGAPPAVPVTEPVTLTVIGTNDLHGHIEALPLLSGYVRFIRKKQAGLVVVVDAGDMFQGTLESNLGEGDVVIDAYNAIGYAAAAVGNHEFDFGPVGDASTPKPGDDPRGALKARGRQAAFPILAANIFRTDTHQRVTWEGMPASAMRRVGPLLVGFVGVSTASTAQTTIAVNFEGLEIAPLAATVAEQAARLRAKGADVIVVLAHAGAACKSFEDPDDRSSCRDDEIFEVAQDLPAGAVDVIVAGHTHAGVAHRVNGIPIIEAYATGIAFGRVDLTVVPGRPVTTHRIYPPQSLCGDQKPPCAHGNYEGQRIMPDPAIEKLMVAANERARGLRERKLGVVVEEPVLRAYARESALGNLFADLMRAARPQADVALTNGGGLRADLPSGELRYGDLYRAMPFDNRFALVRLTGAQLSKLVAANLRGRRGVFSLSGVKVVARCADGGLRVDLLRDSGKPVGDRETLLVVTSDFLASGGDGVFGRLGLKNGAIVKEDAATIRDEMARILSKRAGVLSGDAPALFDSKAPRLRYPGRRPVRCRK